tara:strand:- start:216 stop:410 length:195 start_codon:yes stop_codon:yes gene_type:complete
MIGIVRLKLSRGKYLTGKILWRNQKVTFYITHPAGTAVLQMLIQCMMMDIVIVFHVTQQREEMN